MSTTTVSTGRQTHRTTAELCLHFEAVPGFAVVYVEIGGEIDCYKVYEDLSIDEAQQRYQDLVRLMVKGGPQCS